MCAVGQRTNGVDEGVEISGKTAWQTLNLEECSVARASHYVAQNVCCIDVQTLPCRQRFAGRWSPFAFTVHGSWVAVSRLRVAVPSFGRHTIVARNVCYADVRAVWRISHVVSGIRDDDEQPNVDRRRLFKTERSPFRVIRRLLCVPSLGRNNIVAQNVCYADVRAVWRISRVVSGIRADDEQPNVDRRGLSETERSPFRVNGRLCVPSLGRHNRGYAKRTFDG
jgi:hypothetical protein